VTLARWGRFTLGIFCAHLFFVLRLDGIVDSFHSPAVEVIYPVAVLFLSLIAVSLLSRIKPLRRLVS
jgi:surface polysaccharide O-acyltransferase-like enzyme